MVTLRYFPNPYESTGTPTSQILSKCQNFFERVIEPILTEDISQRRNDEDCLYVGPMGKSFFILNLADFHGREEMVTLSNHLLNRFGVTASRRDCTFL